MSSARTTTSMAITLAAIATLSVAGCKKQPTTPPDSDDKTDVADVDDVEDDEASDEDEDEGTEDEPVPLNKANFDETINEHFSEVSDCYVAALEANAELQGKLDAEFTIAADGKVVSIVAVDGSTLNDEGLIACMNSAATSWTFAVPADGEMKLRYSFNLVPG
jgi:hypothetical protein